MPGTSRSSILATASGALALCMLAAACAPSSGPGDVRVQAEGGLIVSAVDSVNDVGMALAVTLDQEGNPAISYLLYQQQLRPGEVAAAIVPGQPQPPAVLLATEEEEGKWLRRSVTPQKQAPAQGEAPELADQDGLPLPGIATDVAIDPGGAHHVVWGTPLGLFYGTDAAGAFGAPEKVAGSGVGASIAVGANGVPVISFYLGAAVKVATGSGGSWTIEDVASLNTLPGRVPARKTSVGLGPSGPVVAYGDADQTMVATQAGATWSSEAVPGEGGFAVSLTLDGEGNSHVSYMDPLGGVHEAHVQGGGAWEVTDLGSAGAPPDDQQGDPRWATSVALDAQGVHYLAWSDVAAGDVKLATNRGDEFQTAPAPDSAGGQTPALAVSPDGKRFTLAWYSASQHDLMVAQPSAGEPLLAYSPLPVPSASAQPTTPQGPQCEPEGDSSELNIASPSVAGFDVTCLAVQAGAAFSVTLDNTDPAVIHNWALFQDKASAESGTNRLGGGAGPADVIAPGASFTYQLDPLEPGSYFFQCDVHPTSMTGTLEAVRT